MQTHDTETFTELLAGVFDLYQREISTFAARIWWEALKDYDIAVVSQAFSCHITNTDTGQYLPKPADIIRAIEGNSQDSAILAWAKVQRAVGSVGQYHSIVFDDPVIHLTLDDLGGWPYFCQTEIKELPFLQKRFENAYRAHYNRRKALPAYPKYLTGICEAQNALKGLKAEGPRLVGNRDAALRVLREGATKPRLAVHISTELPSATVLSLAGKKAG